VAWFKRRLQFSLATLLWLVVVASLGAALGRTKWLMDQQARELQQVRAELQKYRDEAGYVTVSDPRQMHAIQVFTPARNQWRWRVYLPPGCRYHLCHATANIPPTGNPSMETWQLLDPGETIVHASIEQGPSGEQTFWLRTPKGSAGTGISKQNQGWITGAVGSTSTGVSIGGTQSVPPDKPLELLRLRANVVNPADGQSQLPTGPGPGLMIWIEQERHAACREARR
jgi:hypothetical protein